MPLNSLAVSIRDDGMNPSGNGVGVGAAVGGGGLGVSRFEGLVRGISLAGSQIAASPQESHKCRSDELIAGQGFVSDAG